MANPEPKFVTLFQGSSATNATGTGSIDTLGYDYLNVYWAATSVNPASNIPSTLTLSDNTSASTSSATTLSAATSSLASSASDTNVEYSVRWDIDLEGVERYIMLEYTPQDTNSNVVNAVGVLYKGDEAPTETTAAGVETIIRV